MFGNAPRAVWERWTEVDDQGRIPLSCRCLLLQYNDKNILFETGIGAFFEPKLAERFGVQNPTEHMLIKNLQQAGLSPGDIDYVILSHLHFDHAGGLLPTYDQLQSGVTGLVFPNAKVVVGEEAWQRSIHPHPRDRASFIPELTKRLQDNPQLVVIKPGESAPEDLHPVVQFIYSHGHTPGQMHSLITGSEHRVLFAGDLIPGTAWVHLPITMGYDRFPEQLIDEKAKLYQENLDKDLYLYFTHDPKWAMGLLNKNDKGHFQTQDLKESLKQYQL
jgi:glyoxylase-like metal-dependent hydrolase (beta-lactamase superfamily II)